MWIVIITLWADFIISASHLFSLSLSLSLYSFLSPKDLFALSLSLSLSQRKNHIHTHAKRHIPTSLNFACDFLILFSLSALTTMKDILPRSLSLSLSAIFPFYFPPILFGWLSSLSFFSPLLFFFL